MPERRTETDRNRLMRPSDPIQRVEHMVRDNGRKRTDQFLDPEFPDLGGSGPRAGRHAEFGKLELRNPDRILVTHARRHQPRDLGEHRVIDPVAPDEPPQPADVKLRVAGALIIDQEVNGIACHRRYDLRQAVWQGWRRVVVLADEIGDRITRSVTPAPKALRGLWRSGGGGNLLGQPLLKRVDVLEQRGTGEAKEVK